MDKLNQRLKEFSKSVRETKEFQNYKKASDALEKDIKAKQLLYTFQDAQQTLAVFSRGSFSGLEEQKKKFSELNDEFQKNAVLVEWANAQNELQGLLSNLIGRLSEEIDFPFVASGGGCCG